MPCIVRVLTVAFLVSSRGVSHCGTRGVTTWLWFWRPEVLIPFWKVNKKQMCKKSLRPSAPKVELFTRCLFSSIPEISNENRLSYPASIGFSLAWLLSFTKSLAWLVCRELSLFTPREFLSPCQIPALYFPMSLTYRLAHVHNTDNLAYFRSRLSVTQALWNKIK